MLIKGNVSKHWTARGGRRVFGRNQTGQTAEQARKLSAQYQERIKL